MTGTTEPSITERARKLLEQLQEADPSRQAACLWQLWSLDEVPQAFVGQVISLLESCDAEVRVAAAAVVLQHQREGPAAPKACLALINGGDPGGIAEAISTLNELAKNDSNARDIQSALLTHNGREIRRQVVASLRSRSRLEDGIATLLVSRLEDEDPFVRIYAVDALLKHKMSVAECLSSVEALACHTDRRVRFDVVLMLGHHREYLPHLLACVLTMNTGSSEEDEIADGLLFDLKMSISQCQVCDIAAGLKRSVDIGRLWTWRLLQTVGVLNQDLLDKLAALVQNPDADVAMAATIALAGRRVMTDRDYVLLVNALQHPITQVRATAATAIAECGLQIQDAVDQLIQLLDDVDDEVRGQALQGLMSSGPSAAAALPKLRELVADRNKQIQGLAILAIRAITGLEIPDIVRNVQ